jgi:anti-repressor protein
MENLVIKSEKGNPVTTSLLVAEKFGKRHVEVLDAIRELIGKAENSTFVENQSINKMFYLTTNIQHMPTGGGIKENPLFVMNRDGFSLLVMGFTGEKALKFKIEFINAFNKMESELKTKLPQSFSEALQLAADQAKQLELQAPKVAVYEQISNSDNLLSLNDAAKSIGIGRNKMMAKLRENGILRHNNTPYQHFIDLGLFVVKVKPLTIGDVDKNYCQTFVTGKGITWLTKLQY